jgi:hypothetical protein
MKKLYCFFFLLIGLVSVSCTNNETDNNLVVSQNVSKDLEVGEGESLVLKPLHTQTGATYRWFVNDELVATTPTFKFESTKVGMNKVLLETKVNESKTYTTYSVNVLIQLSRTLSNYSLTSSNGTSTNGGYYWNQTYSDSLFTSGIFTFSHTGGLTSGYNYWDGFTVSNVADTNNYGTTSSSSGWIDHQWGCMAINTSANFLVGYWGYYKDDQSGLTTFSESGYSNWVKIGNGSTTYGAKYVKVAIHPWPYYGILYGDGFTTPFTSGGQFALKVYGVNSSNQFVGPVIYYFVNSTSWVTYINSNWTSVDISSLGNVKYLMFQMSSSDSGSYGMNTAAYFCLNNIIVSQN